VSSFKVTVDATRCRSYGVCVDLSDELFDLDRFGQARVLAAHALDVPEGLRAVAREAAESCPVEAITIREGDGHEDEGGGPT
jgi:ferredoxin